jgi:quercetin dioxygenase-like cupin family protein
MKHLKTVIIGSVLAAAALGLSLAADNDAGFIRITPEHVPFKTASGFEQAILFGDPSKPGLYVLRVRFPPGFHSNPHYHSLDRHVTVIKGVWWMGVGEKLDISKAVPLQAGSYALHPAGGVHWDGARDEETIVQIVGLGPVETVQVDPKREPISSTWPQKDTI